MPQRSPTLAFAESGSRLLDAERATQLRTLIADRELLNACLDKQAYRFAVGRTELDEVDSPLIERTREAPGDGDFEFKQMLPRHVTDPAFSFARRTEND